MKNAIEQIKTNILTGLNNKDDLTAVLLKSVMIISVVEGNTDFYYQTAQELAKNYTIQYKPEIISDNNWQQLKQLMLEKSDNI